MTEEYLDQVLKQALSPEIEDSEIQLRRKVTKMNTKKVLSIGLAVCAALLVVVAGGFFLGNIIPEINSSNGTFEIAIPKTNRFVITANAAELSDDAPSGSFAGLCQLNRSQADLLHLAYRFYISGENIDRVKVSTDKCNIYYATPSTAEEVERNQSTNTMSDGFFALPDVELDGKEYYEHQVVPGQTFEGTYNEKMSFGMSVPQELWSDNDDPKEAFYETTYKVDGAVLTIEVTYTDGSVETHHYKVTAGKVYVPTNADGRPQLSSITRFVEREGESCAPGYLLTQID